MHCPECGSPDTVRLDMEKGGLDNLNVTSTVTVAGRPLPIPGALAGLLFSVARDACTKGVQGMHHCRNCHNTWKA